MNIERDESGGFEFSEVEAPFAALFLSIPAAANPEGSQAAQDRLYPAPSAELRDEWDELVRPELRAWFEAATQTVERDLQPLAAGENTLRIPSGHVDAWLLALNQARLALAARHELGEADLNRPPMPPPRDKRDLAISQIHTFGLLQECLLQGLEEEED